MDFSGTVATEWKLVNLNYLYWEHKGKDLYILNELIASLKRNQRNFIGGDIIF